MAIGEQSQPQPRNEPIGLASWDGLPWTRLVTGVFALAISVAMSWRTEQAPVAVTPTETSVPQQERTVAAGLVEYQEPEIFETMCEKLPAPVATAQLARRPALAPAGLPRHQLRRATTHARVQADLSLHRKAGVRPKSSPSTRIAYAKQNRRRSDARIEYLAAREQVAALTSEDSGSAYLTRLAASQGAARTRLPGHHNKSQASRGAPIRS